jgi:hypothetical protein
MKTDITNLSLKDIARFIKMRKLSPVEVAEAHPLWAHIHACAGRVGAREGGCTRSTSWRANHY